MSQMSKFIVRVQSYEHFEVEANDAEQARMLVLSHPRKFRPRKLFKSLFYWCDVTDVSWLFGQTQ